MLVSLFSTLLLLLLMGQPSSTTLPALNVPLSSAVLLGTTGYLAGLLAGQQSARRNTYYYYRRGRRDTLFSGNARSPVSEETLTDTELVTAFLNEEEPEQCYSMLFCADATGKLKVRGLAGELAGLLSLADPAAAAGHRYQQAVQLGTDRQSLSLCEERYSCSVSLLLLRKLKLIA